MAGGKGINFVVSVDNKKADEAIKQLQQSFKRMESQLRGVGGNIDGTMDKSAQSVNKLGKAVKSTATKITADMKSIAKSMLGFQAFTQAQAYITDFIGEVGRFNKAMKEVSTISSQVAGDIEGYSEKVREMISQIPVGAEESARALYQIESASHHGADALNILQQSAKAAIGGVTDTATAADAITTILNAYHMDASKAQDVSDKLFMTVRNGKTTWNELAHSIANVAPAAASYGVSLDEMLAAIATMTKQGVQTANAVTQLNAVITAGTGALGDGAFRSRSFADAIAMIEHAANGSDLALKAELGNVRAMRAVFTLGGDSAKLFASDLNDISNSAGAASSAYDKMSTTLGAQQKLLKNNLTNLISGFVSSANSSLKNVISYINKAFDSGEAQKFLKAMKELVVVYGAYKATIIATTAVQKLYKILLQETKLTLMLNKLELRRTDIVVQKLTISQAKQVAMTKMLQRSWQTFNATLLSNPIVWVTAAITSLIYATYKLVTADNSAEIAQKSVNRQIDAYNQKTEDAKNKTNEFISVIRDQNKTLYQQEKAYKDLIKQRGIFAKYSIDDLKGMSQDEIDRLINQSDQDNELELREKQIQALRQAIAFSRLENSSFYQGSNARALDKKYGLAGTAFSLEDTWNNDLQFWSISSYEAQWQAILDKNLMYLAQMKQDISNANVTEALVPQASELKGYYDTAQKAVETYVSAVQKIPEAQRDGSAEVAKLSSLATESMNAVTSTILRKKADLQKILAKNPTDINIKTQIENLDTVLADIKNLATLINNGGQPWAFNVLVNFLKGETQFDPTQFNGLDFAHKDIMQSAFAPANNSNTAFGTNGLDFSFIGRVNSAAGTNATPTPTAEKIYKQQIEEEKRRQKEEQRRQREEAKRERENRKKLRDEQRKADREYKEPRIAWDASQALESAETELLLEGRIKSARKALNDYNKTIESLRREYEDVRKQRYSNALAEWQEDNPDWAKQGLSFGKTIDDFTLTETEQKAWDKRNEVAYQAYEKQLKELENEDLEYMLSYLAKYGTMQEQKYSIAKEYDEKIRKEEEGDNNEWKVKSLKKERDNAISQNEAKNLALDIDWGTTFEGVGTVLGDIAKETLSKVEGYMKTDEFKKLSPESKKTYTDLRSKLQEQTGGNSTSAFNFKIWGTIADNIKAYQDSVKNMRDKTEAHTNAIKVLEQAEKELSKATDSTTKVIRQQAVDAAKQNVQATGEEQTQAQQDVDQKQGTLTDNTEKASQGLKNFSSYLNEISSGSLYGFANGVSKLITSLASGSDGVGKSLEQLGGKLGGLIGAILQILDALGDDPKGFIDNILNKVATTIETILDQLPEIVISVIKDAGKIVKGVVSGIAGMFGAEDIFGTGGNAKKVNREEERLNKSLDRVTTALERLREQLDDSKGGWETIKAGEDALKAAQDKQELLSKKLENRMGYTKSHHSNTYNLRRAMTTEDYDKISDVIGRDVRSVDDIYYMSPEEMAKVRANAATMWDKLVTTGDYDWEKYWDEIADAGDEITKIQDEIKEKLTSTTFDSVYTGFRDMLQNMNSSLQDFSDDASEMIYKALMNNFVANEYKDKLKAWYDKMAEYLKNQDGDLTKKQIQDLTAEYTTMAQNAQKQRDAIAQVTGYTDISSQEGSSKGFSGMDQDTAEELNGRFSALQISGEQIATSSRNSIVHLINIDANLAVGVSILDDMRNLQASANSILSDIATYVRPLRLFEEKIDRLITNTNNL